MKKVIIGFIIICFLVVCQAVLASNGTCGTNVAYTVEGNTINFTKADPNLDAVWDYDCSKAIDGVPFVIVNDTIRVTNGNRLFSNLRGVREMHLSKLDVSNVTDMSYMFYVDSYPINISSLVYLDLSGWDVSNVTNMNLMFGWCDSLITMNLSGWDTSSVTNMSAMFLHCTELQNLDVSNWNTSNVTNMKTMFIRCYSLKFLDVSKWDVSNVIDMNGMFADCHSLLTLDVSKWDVSNVTNTSLMFEECKSLKSLDVSRWNVSNVIDMNGMFCICWALEDLDVSNWDTSSVISMGSLFAGCRSLTTLNVSKWDVSNVTNMNRMFSDCRSLKTLNVSGFDVSNVKNIRGMFNGCSLLKTLDVSKWDVSNAELMLEVFRGCSSLTSLDLSNWDTANARNDSVETYAQDMFYNCSSLNSLTLGKNTLNKNIFESLPQYKDTWIYTAQGAAAAYPLELGSVMNNASLFTNYDYTTMAGTWTRSTVDDTVTVTITGHYDFFAYDGEEHTVSGYDVEIDHPLYTESDFEFTGTAEVKCTEVGTCYMGLKESDFVNKSDQFKTVTFLISDGYVEITNEAVKEENAVIEHVNQDGSKGAPEDLEDETIQLDVTIRGKERTWKSQKFSLKTSSLQGYTKTDLLLKFPGSLPQLSGEYEVLLGGLPKYLTGIEHVYGADQPLEHKYYLSYEAWINSEGMIEIVLFWTDERYKAPQEEIAIYPLPEDEIGSYALRADGTKEYLLFHTYDICMQYLGSDELCSGNQRCYHK